MRYYVSLAPHDESAPPIEVDVAELPNGALDVKVGGKSVAVDLVELRSGMSVRIDGRMVDLTVEGKPPEVGIVASGHRSYVRVESERLRAAAAAKEGGAGGGDKSVKSPMPGRVLKLLAAVGDVVEAGQPLLVMEAMKMENEIKAKGPGKVVEVHVKAGDTVERNAKLFTFA